MEEWTTCVRNDQRPHLRGSPFAARAHHGQDDGQLQRVGHKAELHHAVVGGCVLIGHAHQHHLGIHQSLPDVFKQAVLTN